MSGKGSRPRPIPDREQYARNWDRIKWGTLQDFVNASDEDRERLGQKIAEGVDRRMAEALK